MSKDNANPVIHSIVNPRRKEHKILSAFQRWQEGGPVLMALDISPDSSFGTASRTGNSANGSASTSRKLLENAGLQIAPTFASQRGPSYNLSAIQTRLKATYFECHPIERELMDADEVFDMIRNIQDPEHPLTLEQLNVVNRDHVSVHDCGDNNHVSTVSVRFTPTIPHCSMATLIGLSIRVKLGRSLPPRYAIQVQIQPGTHASEHAINKQLADKERVTAALENSHLLGVVNKCILNGMTGQMEV